MPLNIIDRKADLFITGVIASFCGWLFETVAFLLLYNTLADRGLLTLPLCPIYGTTLIIIYVLVGTPIGSRVLLIKRWPQGFRCIVYFLFCFISTMLIEHLVGSLSELITGRVLWSYESYEYALGRYACLEMGFAWGVLITAIMPALELLIRAVGRLDEGLKKRLSLTLLFAITIDMIVNLCI